MKRIIVILAAAISAITMLGGCKSSKTKVELNVSGIRSICEMTTLKCMYHNVAAKEEKANAIFGLYKESKKFWYEFDGIVNLGIDASKATVEIKKETVEITLPEAEVQGTEVIADSIKEYEDDENFWQTLTTGGGIFMSGDNQAKMIQEAQKELAEAVKSDRKLLEQAKENAKDLIKGYIDSIGKLAGVKYEVIWHDASENTSGTGEGA